jgi:DNA-binding CsgD family transcriptional regulator
MLAGRNADALDACGQAVALAQAVGDRVVEGHARNSLGSALCGLGDFEPGLAELHAASEIAMETRSWADAARAATNESSALAQLGRHEEALQIAVNGAEQASAHGLARSFGAYVRLNACSALWTLGRWQELEENLQEIEGVVAVGVDMWSESEARTRLLAARGDFEGARKELDGMRETLGADADPPMLLNVERLEVALLLWSGDFDDAIDRALEATSWPIDVTSLCADSGIVLVLYGLAAAAELAERARERGDQAEEARARAAATTLATRFEQWVDEARWGGALPGQHDSFVAQVYAEAARAEGSDAASSWATLAESWDRFGERPRVAYARLREAEAHVRKGDRTAATVAARAAFTAANEMGWAWVRDGVASLARRARLDLGADATREPSPAERFGLTVRELEVLHLVAEGKTNRQIAERLYISAKTASVHVSNILAKLHVANRSEAGAEARRLGLDRLKV